jgi:hypothetical protein
MACWPDWHRIGQIWVEFGQIGIGQISVEFGEILNGSFWTKNGFIPNGRLVLDKFSFSCSDLEFWSPGGMDQKGSNLSYEIIK